MPRAAKGRSWRVAVLVAALVAGGVAAAEASIPSPESWPSLVEEPAASVLQPPSLEDLAVELAAPAMPPAPDAAAAAGERFRLFEGLELGLARRSEPRFRLYPRLETRARAITLPEPLHIDLELPLTPSRFRFYGDPRAGIAVGGTFISTDPLGYVDGPNLYQYGLNNPVNFSDPLGLCTGQPGDPEECVSWWPYFPPGVIAEAQRNAEGWANNPDVGALDRAGWQAQALMLGFGADFEEMGRRLLNLLHHKYSEHKQAEARRQRVEGLMAELGCGRWSCPPEKRRQLWDAMEAEGLFEVMGPGFAEIPIGPGRFKPRVPVRAVDPNKLHDIFGQAKHNLDDVVKAAGSREAAFDALQKGAQSAVDAGKLTGRFEIIVNVSGFDVTVRGAVVDGTARVGTAFR